MERSIYGPFKGDCVEKGGKFPGYKRKLSRLELFNLSKSFEQVPVTKGRALAVHTPLIFLSKSFAAAAELSRVLQSLTSVIRLARKVTANKKIHVHGAFCANQPLLCHLQHRGFSATDSATGSSRWIWFLLPHAEAATH